MFQILPGIFEVAHVDKKLQDKGQYYLKGSFRCLSALLLIYSGTNATTDVIYKRALNKSLHNHCYTTSDDSGVHCPVINNHFERVFSLVLGIGLNCVPLQNILASGDHRQILYMLSPAERRRLKNVIKLEYYHIERTMTQARRNTAILQTEYEVALTLAHLVAPIHRLPVELLMLIFAHTLDEINPDIDALIRTCHTWKGIVSSMLAPLKLATWTSIDRVKVILEGGKMPLLVTIDPCSDAVDRPIDSLETERYAALTLAALTGISRWRTLDILSLPDPQQTNDFLQRHTPNPVSMNHLRSLSIPVRHNASPFLDLLLPSIGATASVQFMYMRLHSVQAMVYLAQPHCAQVFNYLTSFKCFVPLMDGVINILPHFWQLETLEVSGLRFMASASDVELPFTKTLRQMSLRAVPIGWMNHHEFLRLESCTIFSPSAPDIIPITSLPLCTKLNFEGSFLGAIKKFHIPTACTLTLRSSQWSKSRGNGQLSHLLAEVPGQRVIHPTRLHLRLTCSSEQLLQALYLMPELKKLALELDRPTALGRRFFVGLLPLSSRKSRRLHKRGGKSANPLLACPSLEVLGLKYCRWFRPGESNEMPALVALAHYTRGSKLRIWVEKVIADEASGRIDCTLLSVSILCFLGLLRVINGGLPQSEVVKEMIGASLSTLNPLGTKIYHPETMSHFLPSTYSCLFQQLREFTLNVDIDQQLLFNALAYFERLEVMHVRKIGASSPQPHLPLLKTLRRLELGTTSLLWMDGCTFIKLEALKISNIEGCGDQLQCVRMPMCKSASFPHGTSSNLLNAFKMPQLHNLVLHGQPVALTGGCDFPPVQQFRLRTASFPFVNSVKLQDTLAMQPELEALEITDLVFRSRSGNGLPDLLNILMEPHKLDGFGGSYHSNHIIASLRQTPPLCPKLKELKMTLEPGHEWELELGWKPEQKRKLSHQQHLAQRLGRVLRQVQLQESILVFEQVKERVRLLEQGLKDVGGESQRRSEVHQCQMFMRRRMERGYPVQRCQLVWVSGQTEIARELVDLPSLDIPNATVTGLDDIFASWESYDP